MPALEAEAVTRAIRTLQILSDVAMRHLELGVLATELVERSAELFDADAAALLLRDENLPGLSVRASLGEVPLQLDDDHVRLGEGVLGRLAAEASRRDPLRGRARCRASARPPGLAGELASVLAVPLLAVRRADGAAAARRP